MYLVGVNIRAYIFPGVSNSDCNIGMAKAPVLPEPVSAKPIMSLPT